MHLICRDNSPRLSQNWPPETVRVRAAASGRSSSGLQCQDLGEHSCAGVGHRAASLNLLAQRDRRGARRSWPRAAVPRQMEDGRFAWTLIDGSSPRCIHRQHLAYIGLGYAKLSRNERRFDTRLECCSNGIDLPARQRDRRQFSGLPMEGGFVSSRRAVRGLVGRRQSAAPPHFLEGCRVEQVQFAVAQVLDSFTQVLWKHMSLRGRVGWYLCGRYRLYWRRRTVSARLGREQVWCRLLTAIASHGGDHAAIETREQSHQLPPVSCVSPMSCGSAGL